MTQSPHADLPPSSHSSDGHSTYNQAVFPQSAASTATGQCPPSNVGWAVASIVTFWPLAFVAMSRAVDVYPLWAAGRQAEAEAASAKAKKLGIISLVVCFVLYLAFMILYVALFAVILNLETVGA